jgi:hypothetical protein
MRNLGFKAMHIEHDDRYYCSGGPRPKYYEVGKTYIYRGKPILCEQGFHFCKNIDDVASYYSLTILNAIFLVESLGECNEGRDKSVTNKIKIIRRITDTEFNLLSKKFYVLNGMYFGKRKAKAVLMGRLQNAK